MFVHIRFFYSTLLYSTLLYSTPLHSTLSYLPTYLPICLSAYLLISVCLSIYLSIDQSICLSACLSVCLSVCAAMLLMDASRYRLTWSPANLSLSRISLLPSPRIRRSKSCGTIEAQKNPFNKSIESQDQRFLPIEVCRLCHCLLHWLHGGVERWHNQSSKVNSWGSVSNFKVDSATPRVKIHFGVPCWGAWGVFNRAMGVVIITNLDRLCDQGRAI